MTLEIDLANEEVRLRDRRSRTANKGRRANTVRDQYIVDMVARIEEHGIKPTRNRDSRKKVRSRSGCDIVAQVLKELGVTTLSERTIEQIWERPRPRRATRPPDVRLRPHSRPRP